MISVLKNISVVAGFMFLASCGGGDSVGDTGSSLEAPMLLFPLENEVCNEGEIISETESKVVLKWTESKGAKNYVLEVINLKDSSKELIISATPFKEVTLMRGVAYSWKVSANSASFEKAASSVWKFYNAGFSTQNYAPYPAEVVSPAMGSLAGVSTALKWSTSDIDGDALTFDVYLDKVNPPTKLQTQTSSFETVNLNLETNSIYYWKVVAKDAKNNSSESPVFEFRTP
jgi:hypothetical protein